MPVPDIPAPHESIASEWGIDVHQRVFAPKGCRVSGAESTVTSAAITIQLLDVADDDPGGWLDDANNRLVVPVGAEGLYNGGVIGSTRNGVDGGETRLFIYVNGSEVARTIEDHETGLTSTLSISLIGLDLTAGDVITYRAKKYGTGANPLVAVQRASWVRCGAGYGA
jgi:hypothetical protein